MSTVKLRHIDRFTDRHGRVRHYFRKGKGPRVALPGEPGSEEFMRAYHAVLAGEDTLGSQQGSLIPKTFDHLVRDYFSSADYRRLGPSTQKAYRSVIERLVRDENIGHRLVRQMTRQHVQLIVGKRATTPGAANDVLKKLKILLHFAIDNGWRTDDPTVRIKRFAESEFHTWTDEEIGQFENVWPVGTRERSVFALFVYTGQRASDVAKMSSSDIEGGGIWVVQLKTNAKLLIPMHPALTEALAVCDLSRGTILKTGFGEAFTAKGISNFMADKIIAAGLPDRCVTHGLRKAAARRLAEAGCSANEIQAITGHVSLEEVARYTKAAEQKKLARAAIDRLTGPTAITGFPNLGRRFGKNAKKDNEINDEIEPWRPVGELCSPVLAT